jgi:sporulation protein YabP
MQQDGKLEEHSISSVNRKGVSIHGVLDVSSFDDSHVQLKTVCGEMIIEGEGLKVSALDLDLGDVEILGILNGMFYIRENFVPKRGLFSRNK